MSTQKYKVSIPRIFGVGFASALLATSALAGNSYAEGGSSYFDLNTQACIIENYNAETGASVTAIEDVQFDKITTLNCSNRGMTNFRGLVLLTNLEHLDVSYNSGLYGLDFTFNPKLKTIDVRGMSNSYFDFTKNGELETITTDRSLYLTTEAYAEKTDGQNGGYAIDLSGLKFIDATSAHTVNFATKNDVPSWVSATSGGYTHQISTRGGQMYYTIYLNGDKEAESHNPYYVNNNCEQTDDGYRCNGAVYYGDTFDSDAIIDGTLSKIFNLGGYRLSKVEVVPPTANVELTTDTDTSKKGKVLADANFALSFYFDVASPAVPDTGFFTNEDGGLNVVNTLFVLAGLSIAGFVGFNVYRRAYGHKKASRF